MRADITQQEEKIHHEKGLEIEKEEIKEERTGGMGRAIGFI